MKKFFTIFLVLLTALIASYGFNAFAAGLEIPGASEISKNSIAVSTDSGDSITSSKNFAFRILGLIRMGVSGIALIYLVMIGAYMILGSDSEETIKHQRKQITYALIGFLFLNIPGAIYTIFSPDKKGSLDGNPGFTEIAGGSLFWDTAGFEGIAGNLIAFFRVFIFGIAVLMFTWGIFSMIISSGDDEKIKTAKNRIIYGIIALIFMGFVSIWSSLIALGNFQKTIPTVTGTLFTLVMYFAGPIAIFMITWGGYYFITSAGDEERMKKGKSILINTGIAIIILLSALSFMTELATFQL